MQIMFRINCPLGREVDERKLGKYLQCVNEAEVGFGGLSVN